MAARKSAINLLPKTEFELSFWGRFLKWALTTGRYIIILTEMVVIMAFLSRFKLDKDLLDLNDRISGKKNILEATFSIEETFLSTQARLEQARAILEQTPQATQLVDRIVEHVPAGVSIKNVGASFTDRKVTVVAEATSEQAVGQLIAALSTDKQWRSLDVGTITADATGINFSFSVTY